MLREQANMIAKSLVQILHYTHHYAISFVNGAKACFDTIIPFLCLMATEHLGMTKLATTGVLATIKGMHYFLSKTHVISLGFYTSSTAALIVAKAVIASTWPAKINTSFLLDKSQTRSEERRVGKEC